MLGLMRGFSKSPVAALILFGIVIAFLVGGSKDMFGGGANMSNGAMVQAGEAKAGRPEFDIALDSLRGQLSRQYKQDVPKELIAKQPEMIAQVVNGLTNDVVMAAFAHQIGFSTAKEAAIRELASDPGLKDGLGRLDLEKVAQTARDRNFPSLNALYDYVGQQITGRYLQQAAVSGLKPPAILTKQLEDIYAEQRMISVADFTKDSMPKAPTATEAELREFYKTNLADYAVPELRAFNVIQVSPMDFVGQVKVTDEQIKAAYDKRIKDFSTPETRELTTVKAPDRARVQAVVDLAKQGKSLLDASAATAGTTLETKSVQSGFDKNADFDKAVFAAPKGELMGPFQLDGGWAAAEVKSITPGTPLPLDESRKEQLRDDIAFPDARKVYDQQVDASTDQLASGTSFDDLSRDLNAPILSLPPIDVRGRNEDGKPNGLLQPYLDKKPGEGQQTLLPAAFAMQSGGLPFSVDADYCPPPSQPDRATCRSRLIVQLAGITPPHTRPFEEVRTQVEAAWTRGKITDAVKKASDDIIAKVKAGATLETAAKAAKLNYQVVPAPIDRMNQQIDPNVVEPILKLNKGEIAALQLGNKNGEVALPTLVYVTDARKVDPAVHPEIAQVAQRSVARDLEGDILQVLLRGAALKVKPAVNNAAIEAYAKSIAGTPDEVPQ